MSQGALIGWKEECETVHSEMDRLLTAGWAETAAERQVRKIQFMALIQQRNDAAHNFLKSDGGTAKASINQQEPSEIPALPSAKNPTTEVAIVNGEISQEPSSADHAIGRSVQAQPDDPMFEARKLPEVPGTEVGRSGERSWLRSRKLAEQSRGMFGRA